MYGIPPVKGKLSAKPVRMALKQQLDIHCHARITQLGRPRRTTPWAPQSIYFITLIIFGFFLDGLSGTVLGYPTIIVATIL